MISEVLAESIPHTQYPNGNRTLSICMGHSTSLAWSRADYCNLTTADLPAAPPFLSGRYSPIPGAYVFAVKGMSRGQQTTDHGRKRNHRRAM